MEITSPGQITGPVAKKLRQDRGMTQTEFWAPVGVPYKGMASNYERDVHRISEPLQILIYLHHICRFPVGLDHNHMSAIGAVLNSGAQGLAKMKQATAIAEAAIDHLKSARSCMEEI